MSVKFVLLAVLPIIVQFAVCSPKSEIWGGSRARRDHGHPYQNYSDFENRHTDDFLWAKDIPGDPEVQKVFEAYYACIDGYLYEFDKLGSRRSGELFHDPEYRVDDALKCFNCLAISVILRAPIAGLVFGAWCRPNDYSVPIKSYRGRSTVDEKELSRRFVTAKAAVVRNEGNLTQEGLTPEYEKSVTETVETRMAVGSKMSSKVSVEVPLVASAEVGMELSEEWSKTNTKSWTETIRAPAQKVIVGPESQVHAKWSLYEFTRVYTYGVSFEIDEGLSDNVLSGTYKRLAEWKRRGLLKANFNDGNGIWLELTDDERAILHNIPMTEVATGHEVDYEIGRAEPLNSPLPSDVFVYNLKPIH